MSPDALKSTIGQRYLFLQGFYQSAIDGEWGPLSISAANQWAVNMRDEIAKRLASANDRGVILAKAGSIGFLRTLAAQIHLADLKLYTGPIDGAWGPQSRDAATLWFSIQQPEVPSDKPATVLTPYDVALQHLGVREVPGKENNPKIVQWARRLATWVNDDETAWCSSFANFCAAEAGYESSGKLNARSWLDVGAPVSRADVRKGDIAVFWRGSPDAWTGHVAFFESWAEMRSKVRVLGGNQSDKVCLANYNGSQILGFRRLRTLASLQGPSNKI